MQLPLPISPVDLLLQVIRPALKFLPLAMTSEKAEVLLIAISGQEANFEHRWQVVDRKKPEKRGPARGLWQFELGKKGTGAGVWGVFEHAASRYWLAQVCKMRAVPFDARSIWLALEDDDLLAACVARLLLFTDPKALPEVSDADGAWKLYRYRTWRPGKPHPEKWVRYHTTARRAVADNKRVRQ